MGGTFLCAFIYTANVFDEYFIPDRRLGLPVQVCHKLWRHQMETFSTLLALCEVNPPVTDGFPSQRPVTRSLDVFIICVWTNGWANNRDAGDLTCHRTHYDVTVMVFVFCCVWFWFGAGRFSLKWVRPATDRVWNNLFHVSFAISDFDRVFFANQMVWFKMSFTILWEIVEH